MRDKSIKLIATFLVLLFLSSIFNFSPTDIRKSENFQINIKKNKPKASKFWILGGITIYGNDSWANLALNSELCSGSGNWSDPYIIQNVTIDGQNNSDYGIRIRNSDVYFKIINCTVYNVKYEDHSSGCTAITLFNVKNGFLINNSCSFNERAIGLENCENLTIIGNNITNNDQTGLYMYYSDNNTICDNNILDTYFTGIYQSKCKMNIFYNNSLKFNCDAFILNYSNKTIVSKNIVKNNRYIGITLSGAVSIEEVISFNEVLNNFIENNTVGIALGSGHNFKIYNNTIKKNRQDGIRISTTQNSHFSNNQIINNSNYGMYFYLDSSNNTIEKNIITNNTDGLYFYMNNHNNTIFANDIINNINYGIKIGGENNIIFLNNFSYNGNNVKGGGNNNWDNGSIGNYWSDYGGVDADDDGIGDTPYSITGLLGSQDYYPIWDDGDDLSPNITILEPFSNQLFSSEAPSFVVEIRDVNLHKMWYTLDNGLNNYTFITNTTINQIVWDLKLSGTVTIRFYANDTLGNTNYSGLTIKKDVAAPIMTINNPQNDYVIGATAPNFNITIDESNLDKVWYSLNGGTNITFTGLTGIINQALWDALPKGNVVVKFYANDTLGRIGFAEVTIKKDVTDPIITIINPQNNDLIGATAPNFNISIDEPNLDKVWYSLNSGTNKTFTGLTGIINQVLWDALLEGNAIIRFYANDTLGRIGFSEVTIKKDITAPIITINTPQNNVVVGAIAPNFNISIDEPNLDKVWYSLNGGINTTFTELTGTVDQTLWDALPEGNITIRFYVNDLAGNIGFQEVTVIKKITPSSVLGIPGYDLLFLLGIISTLAVIIIKKRVNDLK